MPDARLFVFTAGTAAARLHLADSIDGQIAWPTISDFWDKDDAANLEALDTLQGLYAWGAEPGQRNVPIWESMQPGDWVLCVYDNAYRYVAQVEAKYRNRDAAEAIWGLDPNGASGEYIYFLSKPRPQ